MKTALVVAINDYPLRPLRGCVPDAAVWTDTLSRRGYVVRTLLNSQADAQSVVRGLLHHLRGLKAGDVFVFVFAGHGTWRISDDPTELHCRDDAICCFENDKPGSNLIFDDAFSVLWSLIPRDACVCAIFDSCHSGNMFRGAVPIPSDALVRSMDPVVMRRSVPKTKPIRRGSLVHMAACRSNQFAYDVAIGGGFHGLFSYHACDILRNEKIISYADFQREILSRIPTPKFPQRPCLAALRKDRHRRVLE